jgi:alcohol dehydrogenase class IV
MMKLHSSDEIMESRDKEIEVQSLEIFSKWPRTKIIFGSGTLNQTGKCAKEFGKKALIVIGGGSVKSNGILDKTIANLKKSGVTAEIFEGVEPNPSKETMESIAKRYKDGKFEVMIALGGGSAMDAAKAALILTSLNETDLTPYFGVGEVSKKIKRITGCICIPTTAGTSSEITRYSNVTIKSLGLKKLISDIAIHPHYAIIDPDLTVSCPKDLTLTVGLDTLTHLMEGYLNTVQDPGNDDINQRALFGIELVLKWLKKAALEPQNIDARKMMSIACTLGGTVIGGERFKGTGGPHMNSFSWAETIPHGKSTGIMLPYYIVYYAKNPVVIEKLKIIADLLKIKKTTNIGKDVATAMLKWYKEMGFETKLSELPGWKPEYLEKALKDAGQNEMKLKAMPNPITVDDVDKILRPILQAAQTGDLSKII